jgi:hypothetical protein
MASLKVYVCTDHDYFWPLGTASVVLAVDEEEARRMLDDRLQARRLKPHEGKPYTLREITGQPGAYILCDGNY